MRRIATVGTRHDQTAHTCGPAWPTMARSTAVRESGADRERDVEIAATVTGQGSRTLLEAELALEQLPAAPDRAKRIARDDVRRGIRRVPVAAPGPDLLGERPGDAFV